jgi:uncharacterized protein (DUF1330 family)
MKHYLTLALTFTAGIGIGAAAVQKLHAQANPKAYTVTEVEVINPVAQDVYSALIVAAVKAAGGRNFNTAGGRIIAFTGEAPKRVAINEWDSVEQAQAFRNSTAWKNLAPQRERAHKDIRAYVVEANTN